MESFNQLSRPLKYALLCAAAAGLVGTFLINFVSVMLSWTFVPSVIIMVFTSAYFAFRRQMRAKGRLDSRRIFLLSLEVGTLSHLYTFALYLPLNFFFVSELSMNSDTIGLYFLSLIVMTIASIIMYIWIAVPMYLGIGYILMSAERTLVIEENDMESPILDSKITANRRYRNSDLDF